MKTQGQVRHKFKLIMRRSLEKRLKQESKKIPANCHFNLFAFSTNKEGDFPRICIHPDQSGLVCDPRHGGMKQAGECPLWKQRNPPTQIKENFRKDYVELLQKVREGSTHPEFQQASALLWVLDGDVKDEDTDAEEEAPENKIQIHQGKTWRKWRIWPWNWGWLHKRISPNN